jgi:hypothetical protein
MGMSEFYDPKHDENLGAVDVTLTHDDLDQIDAALPAGSTAGDRYPAQAMQAVNR